MCLTPDTRTALYGIIGHPVAHSLSPAVHNAAFRQLGINAAYLAFDVTMLAEAVAGIRALGIRGVSVTIPHKEAIIPLLDETDTIAERMGAVNTVVNRAGRLSGTNTDWIGAVKALEEVTNLRDKHVLVIGAGGSARAVCIGLVDRGAVIHVANRTPERARDLAAVCGGTWSGLDSMAETEASILINTTSVGMKPDAHETPFPSELLHRFSVVMDLVYSPLETRLLKEAGDAGCHTVYGSRMLLYQAAAQFEIWTGRPAPVSIMEEALDKNLAGEGGA